MVEFLEHVLAFTLKQDLLYFHLSFAEESLFFVFSKESKFFAAKKKSGLHKRELLKCHESFTVLVFEESL